MKYHKCIIKKVPTDLGEDEPRLNFTYKIYQDNEFKGTALTLSSAKEFVDSNFDDNVL